MMEKSRIDKLSGRPFSKFFPNAIDDIKRNICPVCSCAITEFKDDISFREYNISGMCQKCQDKVFV